MLLNYHDFGTVAASEVNECCDSVTFHKLTAINIVIGDTSDGGMVLSREHRKYS